MYANSRKQAHHHRSMVAEKKKRPVVGRREIKMIKEYAGDIFGDRRYWPWLACYMEIRGEFKEGWIPNNYYSNELIRKLNPSAEALLSTAKSFDYRLFENFSIKPLAVRISGGYFGADMEPLTEEEFLRQMKKYKQEVVLKMDGGPRGKGLAFKDSIDVTPADFLPGSNYVVQPVFEQHKLLKQFNSSSLNTIRIVTLYQSQHCVTCRYAVLKFGSVGSRVDNYNINQGGRFFCLDENGELEAGPFNHWGQNTEPNYIQKHGLDSFSVPNFREAVMQCTESHLKFPYVRMIGWDVAIGRDGNPRLVEWNAWEPGIIPEEALLGPVFPIGMSHPKLLT
jgi:hypothetical protein